MKIITNISIMTGIALLLVGCNQPSGPYFRGFSKPQSNKGLLYIYRPNSFGAAGRNYYVYDLTNKQYIGSLGNGVYLEYHTSLGTKHIAIYEKAPDATQIAAITAVNLLTSTFASYGVSNKPDAVYPVTLKAHSISCLKWDASYRGFNSFNGVVDNSTCAKDIVETVRSR